MKKALLIFFFLFCFFTGYSTTDSERQQLELDTLHMELEAAKTDSAKCEAYYQLGYYQLLRARDVAGASKNLFAGLELAERKNYPEFQAMFNDVLAWLESRKENHFKAVEYMRKATEYYETSENPFYIFKADYNLGCMLMSAEKLDEAEKRLLSSLAYGQKVDNKNWTLNSLQALAGLYHQQNRIEEAIKSGLESAAIMQDLRGNYGNGRIPSTLAELYAVKKDFINANKWIKEAFVCAERVNDLMIYKEVHLANFEIQKLQGNATEALKSYELYILYKDSIFNDEALAGSNDAEAKYLSDVKKLEEEKAATEKQLIESERRRSEQQRNWLIGGVALVLIVLLIVVQRFRVTKKQKIVIEHQKLLVDEKNKEIVDSINYAKRIQSAILPPDKLVKEYLKESFILYKPKDIVAGDFYWLEVVGNKVLFAAADCTGHGVPGAMVSVVCNNGLNRSVREHKLVDPGKILDKTREIVIQEFEKSEEEVKDGMDIALCSIEDSVLHYAGAHNPLWIIRNNAAEIEEIKADKQPIGQTENPKPYSTHKVELNKGDTIYIFSDGYADQFGGEKDKKMKTVNFKKLLLSIKEESMGQQKELINQAFEDWKGPLEQLDDVCVIGIRV